MSPATVTRSQVLRFRVRAQQLDRADLEIEEAAALDIGVQDTGPDGAGWALSNRGVDLSSLSGDVLVKVWTILGAPHVYRREHLPLVAAAVEPFSQADAGKRIFDAAKPPKVTGISNLDSLDAVAAAMRSVVTKPMAKGDVSTQVTALMDPVHLRFCRACNATHFVRDAVSAFGAASRPGAGARYLSAGAPTRSRLRGGRQDPPRNDVVRASLRLLGPATPKQVAVFLDAPFKDVTAHWPGEVVEVSIEGEPRWVLSADVAKLTSQPAATTRLLGPFDLFLQARDRPLLVDDPARAKAMWPILGRPGAVLLDGQIAGMWRPRKSGKHFRVHLELWERVSASTRRAISERAARGVPAGALVRHRL